MSTLGLYDRGGRSWADMSRIELRNRERTTFEIILENKLMALYADLEAQLVEQLEYEHEPSRELVDLVHEWSSDLYRNGILDTPEHATAQHIVSVASQLLDSSNPCSCSWGWGNEVHADDCPAADSEGNYYD